MSRILLACTLVAGLGVAGVGLAGAAHANVCQTDNGRTCATGMPIEGYCECNGQGGTVVQAAAPRQRMSHRMSHPDCGANPQASGCQQQ